MLKKYETQLFEIKPSKYVVYWLLLLHSLAILAILITTLDWFYKTSCIALIFFSGFVYQKYFKRKPKTIYLRHSEKSGWEASFNNVVFYPMKVLSSNVITANLVILNFQLTDQEDRVIKHTNIISQDCMPSDNFRKLRATLRIYPFG